MKNKWILVGLGVSLAIAGLLSPFASKNPDGLDRVAEDLKFTEKATAEPIANKLPFAQVFEEYAVKGVPETLATPLAGIIGTVATFGLAWGIGKITVRGSDRK
jgi:cobalt/nickel transport protein